MANQKPLEVLHFYNKRDHEGTDFFEWYRCYDAGENVLFSARAVRLGKPMPVFKDDAAVVEINNRKGYLVNGRTDIQCLETGRLIGSYSRLGNVFNADDQKAGRWRDARKWSEEFKESVAVAIGNALLGAGDAPSGGNHSGTQLFSAGKEPIAVLQSEVLPFFPDPPKSLEPNKFAKLASRVIPGPLGKSLGEVTPPYGWTLSVLQPVEDVDVLRYSALVHLEYLRWSRTS